ncbi:TetR/AcrR family transcriptional regulator [Agrococcus sp. SGAir0287]|uniref:TetR/AcrR family transcriptional regulator n=1 Tax=Agrococcus sp. SGAir0287 TaxID=2070347 RepID=UPI0010CCDE89|nr:TetR family transcriptional regulator [Agrococcus sp. SGAir0287]QCR18280.1 TetR family transcriptional regulator [Agrococcus sp. SGAir0287]
MTQEASDPPRRPSLRERKRLHTRRAIADAAFALASEHGLEGLLLEDIAERAFVSPRTLSNYFPSKEAAIVAADEDDLGRLTRALLARPADEPPLDSLRDLLGRAVREWTPEQLAALRTKEHLVADYPTLLPFRMAQYDALEDAIRTALAERMGVAATEPHHRLIASAAASVVKTAVRTWVLQDAEAPTIGELVDAGFDDLAAGLAS